METTRERSNHFMKNNKVTNQRKRARQREDEKSLALESCRGYRTVIGYLNRFRPEARHRILAAATVLCG